MNIHYDVFTCKAAEVENQLSKVIDRSKVKRIPIEYRKHLIARLTCAPGNLMIALLRLRVLCPDISFKEISIQHVPWSHSCTSFINNCH